MTKRYTPPGARLGGINNDAITFRENRPSVNSHFSAPKDVKQQGPAATAKWNAANLPNQHKGKASGKDAMSAAMDALMPAPRKPAAQATAPAPPAPTPPPAAAPAPAPAPAPAVASKPKAASTRKATPAQARKAAAVEAYTKQFGHAPDKRMTTKSLEFALRPKAAADVNATAMQAIEPVRAPAPAPTPAPAPAAKPAEPFKLPNLVDTKPGPMKLDHIRPVRDVRSMAIKGTLAVGVGAAAVQGYMRARDHGDSIGVAAAKGALEAAPQAFVAAAPQIEKAGQFMKEVGYGTAKTIAKHYDLGTWAVDHVTTGGALMKSGFAAGAVGVAGSALEKTARFAGKFALPAALGVGAVMGAMRDENHIRGAARGAISALDPTALFMKRGLLERGFNAAFGEESRPGYAQPTLNRANPATDTHEGKGGISKQSRLSAPKNFAAADDAFKTGRKAQASEAANHRRGFQNPNNLYAALKAQGASTANVAMI